MSQARKQDEQKRAQELEQARREAAAEGKEQHQHSERTREAGLSGREVPGQGPSADFQAPDTIIDENTVRPATGTPRPAADLDGITGPEEDLSVVGVGDIGGGEGLDEAELGRADPLDGKKWDGDESDPLQAAEAPDENFPSEKGGPAQAEDEGED